MASFDVKLIPEFDGSGDVLDWLEKVELVCGLQEPPVRQTLVIPLRLTGGASAVYRQLVEADRKDVVKLKDALKRAFAVDKYAAYEQFSTRRLRPGETVDVFLAELQQLATLFGGMSDEGLGCAFVAGLPDSTRQILRAGARMESLKLSEVVDRARAILREENGASEVAAALVKESPGGEGDVCAGAGGSVDLAVEKEDFRVVFDARERRWTVEWKWSGKKPPDQLKNGVSEYHVTDEAREDYERELETWIENGWLLEYDEEKHGSPKGLIPLMAVVQENKAKVRPVLDFREMNTHLDTFTADVDVCSEKLREWRRTGEKVALLDLKKAYLQIHVEESLWPYQTIEFKNKRYCLTRLGYGLNVAPRVMKTVLETVAKQDKNVEKAVSSYVDDVLVNEEVMSAEKVAEHLQAFGLECKDPARAQEGARILGLRVWGEQGALMWKRDNDVREAAGPVTKRKVFSLCGQLTGHLPVCGWLRPATSLLKRRANRAASGWDDEIDDPDVERLMDEIVKRVRAEDPARGRWDVKGDRITVWTDASALAMGVVVEVGDEVVEDGSWLRPDNGVQHINMAELDAALKGVNMAILWGAEKVRLMTDSRTVYHWMTDLLSGRARLKTKAASEMLIRRRLSTLRMLVDEYELDVNVQCVSSAENKADALTRVPDAWQRVLMCKEEAAACAVGDGDDPDRLVKETRQSNQFPQRQSNQFLGMRSPALYGVPSTGMTETTSKTNRRKLRVTQRLGRGEPERCVGGARWVLQTISSTASGAAPLPPNLTD
ncbi:uncharacterized protein LOC122372905 [Amphibalanus amphitrite]|uniref:uncharacterized protein LOC122372905 n=1 Tax=Amphibalanus amphitrite TaxID=1232801 RepID=UPI001C8FEA02|nr:uncharacterized protein LOC122372905 [Amphibalanus amphitrite]